MRKIAICKESGHRPSRICPNIDSLWVQESGLNSKPCPYHSLAHLDQNSQYQVNSDCYPPNMIKHVPWFILPPVQEWYFKKKTTEYLKLPPFIEECQQAQNNMELIYPKTRTQVFIPKEVNGKRGKVVFELAHRKPKTKVYWHLDTEYLGTTQSFHEMELQPEVGKHKITLVDETGETFEKWFEVVN